MIKPEQLNEKDEAKAELRRLFKAADYRVYTKLDHVSRSGMMRHVDVMVLLKDGPHHVNHLIAKLGGYRRVPRSRRSEGLLVEGGGMDMGFSVVYNTSRAVFPQWKCDGSDRCRSNDHANGKPRRKGIKHSDTGYLLRQSWI